MTKDEVLRMALDALENLFGTPPAKFGGDVAVWRIGGSSRSQQAIDAIKEVLAQPERKWVGLTKEDMPNGENPMFDHEYFIAGMVFAAKILEKKNT